MAAFPGGAEFAFTILDDTDDATVENVEPVYRLLTRLGMRTTKTAWPLDCPPEEQGHFFAAETLQDPDYLAFVRGLVDAGFELAFHNATMGSSVRERTLAGLQTLEDAFGTRPVLHCNHAQNRENLYWGAARYRSTLLHGVARLGSRAVGRTRFEGEVEGSPYFWGDVAHETFRYVRSFAFARLDTSSIPPGGPYRDPTTRWVRLWFNTSDAPDAAAFNRLVTPAAVETLRARGGYAIVSTHLGKGFATAGRVDPQVEEALGAVAELPGWFVPVTTLLDHLVAECGAGRVITTAQRWRLEYAHVLDRVRARLVRRRA